MKVHQKLKFVLQCVFLLSFFFSCTKDIIVPIDIENKVFSFTEDIEPLIKENCSATSCHGGSVKPLLTSDIYSVLENGDFIIPGDTAKARDSKLYKKLNGTHNDGRMSDITKRSLEIWMEQGSEGN